MLQNCAPLGIVLLRWPSGGEATSSPVHRKKLNKKHRHKNTDIRFDWLHERLIMRVWELGFYMCNLIKWGWTSCKSHWMDHAFMDRCHNQYEYVNTKVTFWRSKKLKLKSISYWCSIQKIPRYFFFFVYPIISLKLMSKINEWTKQKTKNKSLRVKCNYL